VAGFFASPPFLTTDHRLRGTGRSIVTSRDRDNFLLDRYRVSVVIPTLNEADNLPHVLPRLPKGIYEVILVDGHSTDETIAVAQQLIPDVRVVMQPGRGKGDALRAGFAAATGDIIVMLDADGSMDPAEIQSFISVLIAGADFAKGSRFLHGAGTADMPAYRKLGNMAFVWLVRILFGGRFSDLCYGYNAFWTSVLPILELDGDGFEIETIMNVRALRTRLKITEVPSFEARRIYGDGRLRTIPDGWRVLKAIIREHFQSDRSARTTGSANTMATLPRKPELAPILIRVPGSETRTVRRVQIDNRTRVTLPRSSHRIPASDSPVHGYASLGAEHAQTGD
jgi:hypothetical protein